MQHSALRVNTRCLRRSVRRPGLPERLAATVTWDFMIPPGPDATMMRPMPLRGVHHRCACWRRDASGCSRLHRMHHRRSGERCPAGAAAAGDPPGLRTIGHLTRLTWQPAALVAPHASRAWRQAAARHAGAPPCRGRGRHASQAARPVEAPDLALLRGPGDPCGNHQPGSSLQGSLLRLSYSAWFRNLLPTSCFKRLVSGHYRQAARLTADTGPDAALAFYLSKADPLLVLRDLLGH